MPNRQRRRPISPGPAGAGQDHGLGSGAGKGIDVFGGPVIDPTENVLSLVDAESRRQDGNVAWLEKHHDALMKSETRRIDDLAALRLQYDTQISENLRIQVKTTSELISTQLDKVTTSLSSQITAVANTFSSQITALTATINARLADLERFRWESGGKTSVSDPATAEALQKMALAINGLKLTEGKTEARGSGRSEVVGWIVAGVVFVSAAIGIATAIVAFAR